MKPLYGHPVSWNDRHPDLDEVQSWEMDCLQGARDQGFRSVLMQASMGTGKTVLAVKSAKYLETVGRRMMFICHMDTLIEQAEKTFTAWGVDVQVEHGKRKAKHSFGRPPHVIASKASLYERRMEDFLHRTRLNTCEVEAWLDECHLSASRSWATPVRALNPVYTVGLSGTPTRLDGKPLVGREAPFESLVCRYDFLSACRHRNLVPPMFAECEGSVDLRNIRTRKLPQGEDYDPAELTRRINENLGYVCRVAKEQIHNWGVTRSLMFLPDIATARHAERLMTGLGFSCRSIYGEMSKSERDVVKRAYHRGDLDILMSCQMLDVGFDDPPTDGIILATPSKSAVKILQQGGRGSRLFPGKSRYVVIGYRWETDDDGPQSTLDLLLRGVPDVAVRRRAGDILRRGTGVDLLAAVEQAEIEEAQDRQERRRSQGDLPVACVDAPAPHKLRVYDPLALGGDSLTKEVLRDLRRCKLEPRFIAQLTPSRALGFLKQWLDRTVAGMSTFRQVERLVHWGWREEDALDLTAREARNVIYSIKVGRRPG